MDTPQIGQIVRLNRPKSVDHERRFMVVAVHPGGKLVDLRKRGDWKTYTEPVANLMHPDWLETV